MSDAQSAFDGLTLTDLQAGSRALSQAIMTGALSVQYGDGSRVQYRSIEEINIALRQVNARIAGYLPAPDPTTTAIRAFRVRPWNGFA